MRIKVRAWNKICKHMFYNVQYAFHDIGPDSDEYFAKRKAKLGDKAYSEGKYTESSHHGFGDILEDKDYIEMLFTGIDDKNKKEIYDRDIIMEYPGFGCEWKPRKGCIIYSGASFWVLLKNSLQHILDNHDCSIEIIGNEYENPELWEEITGEISKYIGKERSYLEIKKIVTNSYKKALKRYKKEKIK